MSKFLHLVKPDSGSLAGPVVAEHCRDPGAQVTVVLLHGAATPELPDQAIIRRLGHDLDASALLDLIFESDRVITW